jgi:hypothetical protein
MAISQSDQINLCMQFLDEAYVVISSFKKVVVRNLRPELINKIATWRS